MKALLNLPQSPSTRETILVSPDSIDYFVTRGATESAVLVYLSSGHGLQGEISAHELHKQLRSLPCEFLSLGRGSYLNIRAVESVRKSSAGGTMLGLRGGTSVLIDPAMLPAIDLALAKSHGIQTKAAA